MKCSIICFQRQRQSIICDKKNVTKISHNLSKVAKFQNMAPGKWYVKRYRVEERLETNDVINQLLQTFETLGICLIH